MVHSWLFGSVWLFPKLELIGFDRPATVRTLLDVVYFRAFLPKVWISKAGARWDCPDCGRPYTVGRGVLLYILDQTVDIQSWSSLNGTGLLSVVHWLDRCRLVILWSVGDTRKLELIGL